MLACWRAKHKATHFEGMNADIPSAEYLIEESLASLARMAATWSSLKSPDISRERAPVC
jgi:hypothetical protein